MRDIFSIEMRGLMDDEWAGLDPAKTGKRAQYGSVPFDFRERAQLCFDVAPVEVLFVPERDSLGVANVERPRREKFEDQQILGRARAEIQTGAERVHGRAADRAFLEGKCAQGNIDPHIAWACEKQNAMAAGKFRGVGNAAGPFRE
jgi:hypothetical protein